MPITGITQYSCTHDASMYMLHVQVDLRLINMAGVRCTPDKLICTRLILFSVYKNIKFDKNTVVISIHVHACMYICAIKCTHLEKERPLSPQSMSMRTWEEKSRQVSVPVNFIWTWLSAEIEYTLVKHKIRYICISFPLHSFSPCFREQLTV